MRQSWRRVVAVRTMLTMAALVLVAAALSACSDDDADGERASSNVTEPDDASGGSGLESDARFCEEYLGYLADSRPANLDVVVEAADDEQVAEYAQIITSDADVTAVLAATADLDELARGVCQADWTAGVQGAGSTGAAAQAFLDAVVAGDRAGAANVAAANAIAVFEPWEPIGADAASGTPSLGDVGERIFTMVLGPARIAQCEVVTGVVVACMGTE